MQVESPKERLTQADLARELGVSKPNICRWRQQDWWPRDENGELSHDLHEVAAAISYNAPSVARVGGLRTTTLQHAQPGRRPPPGRVLNTLKDADAPPLRKAKAVLTAATWSLCEGLQEGFLRPQDFGDAAAALREVRQAERELLAQQKEREELVPKDVAAAAAGELSRLFLQTISNLGNSLQVQHEIWIGDKRWRELSTGERVAQLRDWYDHQVRSLREELANRMREVANGQGAPANGGSRSNRRGG